MATTKEGPDFSKIKETNPAHVKAAAKKAAKKDGNSKPKNETKAEEKPKKELTPWQLLAKQAQEIAAKKGTKLGSAITAGQAEKVSLMMAERNMKPDEAFGSASEQRLLVYAQGGSKKELPEETSKELREFCKASEDRRIWPRKVAALVLAMRRQ